MNDAGSGFVTVAEAAEALGISVRQAQRDARHLSDNDRHVPDKGATRVRLVALAALRGQHILDKDVSDNGRHETTEARQHDATWRDIDATLSDTQNDLVEQLRSEVAYLRAALEKEQETARAALSELSEFRHQAAVMIAATATGQIPPQTTPQEAPEAPQSGDRDEAGESGHAQDCEPQEAKPRRAWWRFW